VAPRDPLPSNERKVMSGIERSRSIRPALFVIWPRPGTPRAPPRAFFALRCIVALWSSAKRVSFLVCVQMYHIVYYCSMHLSSACRKAILAACNGKLT
jgi:hypothetical protein